MSISLSTVYTVDDRQITPDDGTLLSTTLIDLMCHDELIGVFYNGAGSMVACDLFLAIRRTSNVDFLSTLQDFITKNLMNDLGLARAQITYFPLLNVTTKTYPHRLTSFDPTKQTGIDIQYGRMEAPTELGPQFRANAKDLLFRVQPNVLQYPTECNNWLVSVNGVLHKTVVDDQEPDGTIAVWVIDAFENIRQSKQFSLCVLDTTTLGGHQILPLTSDAILPTSGTAENGVIFNFKDQNFLGKTVLLCFDGYLRCLDDSYTLLSPTAIKIDTPKLDWKSLFLTNPNHRYTKDLFDLRYDINPYSGLPTQLDPTTTPDANDGYLNSFIGKNTIAPATLDDPACLLSRFTTNHSFLVIINNDHIYKKTWEPLTYGDSGFFFELITEEVPRGFMQYNHGKVIPYVMLSAATNRRTFYIDQLDITTDDYKTAKDLAAYTSPRKSILDKALPKRVVLTELYSGQGL